MTDQKPKIRESIKIMIADGIGTLSILFAHGQMVTPEEAELLREYMKKSKPAETPPPPPAIPEWDWDSWLDNFCKHISDWSQVSACGELEEMKEKLLASDRQKLVAEKITGETSDGYHTFNELYEFRKLYNAVLFNEWAGREFYDVHKSKRHSDGELCFGGGWFIVVAQLPDGQISNHYELKDWDMFHCEEREKANTWDGHTEKDVVERLNKFIKRGFDT